VRREQFICDRCNAQAFWPEGAEYQQISLFRKATQRTEHIDICPACAQALEGWLRPAEKRSAGL